MQRYQIVPSFVHAGIAGLMYLFLQNESLIDQLARPYNNLARGAAVLLLPFLFNRSTFIANTFIEKLPLVSVGLRRLLSRQDFIEGDWPLVVMEQDKRTLKYFGFLTIKYEKGQLVVFGEDWNPDGTPAVKFRSQQESSYADRKLQYWYAQGAGPYEPTMFGYTRIYFFPEHGPIERHAGEFLDKEHRSPPFYARRIPYKAFQHRLRTKEERFEAARSFWAEIEPKILAAKDPRIDRDFV